MQKLEAAKSVIRENYRFFPCGIFNNRNFVGDYMETIYDEGGLTIDVCREWEYFEVFGLSSSDFHELADFYASLGKERRSKGLWR